MPAKKPKTSFLVIDSTYEAEVFKTKEDALAHMALAINDDSSEAENLKLYEATEIAFKLAVTVVR